MATTNKFKQINPFIARVKEQANAAHLSWMQRFVERINSNIIVTMAEDCPAMITAAYQALAAAVAQEDAAYRIINRSPLTEQIAEADQTRDNTFVGLRTMVEALGRVGTQAQKEAAPRVLQAMRDYQVGITENYELESTHIAQLIQQLEVAPLATDCTTLAVTALVAQLKTENQQVQTLIGQSNQEVGESPYDYAIGIINQDEEYYIQHVFPKAKLKKMKITDEISFYFTTNETWKKAVEQHPEENADWTVTEDDELYYQTQRLLDAQGNAVDATKKVDDTKQYQLEQPAEGSDVTPVTPE